MRFLYKTYGKYSQRTCVIVPCIHITHNIYYTIRNTYSFRGIATENHSQFPHITHVIRTIRTQYRRRQMRGKFSVGFFLHFFTLSTGIVLSAVTWYPPPHSVPALFTIILYRYDINSTILYYNGQSAINLFVGDTGKKISRHVALCNMRVHDV